MDWETIRYELDEPYKAPIPSLRRTLDLDPGRTPESRSYWIYWIVLKLHFVPGFHRNDKMDILTFYDVIKFNKIEFFKLFDDHTGWGTKTGRLEGGALEVVKKQGRKSR